MEKVGSEREEAVGRGETCQGKIQMGVQTRYVVCKLLKLLHDHLHQSLTRGSRHAGTVQNSYAQTAVIDRRAEIDSR